MRDRSLDSSHVLIVTADLDSHQRGNHRGYSHAWILAAPVWVNHAVCEKEKQMQRVW